MSRSILHNLIYSYKSSSVDNFVFRLVSRWTIWILVILSFVATWKIVFEDSFTCMTSYDAVPQRFLDMRCYTELYSLPQQSNRQDMLFTSSRSVRSEELKRYMNFYSLVNLMFVVHAFVFHKPHLLWSIYESGYVERLTAGLQVALSKEQKRSLEIHCLAKYVFLTRGKHTRYTSMFIFFEVCNFFISITQTIWLFHFFNITGAPDSPFIDLSTWSGYRNFYFPPTGSCTITKHSASGERVTLDAICALPLNEIYMKMFIALRFWYIFLIFMTGLVIIYRLALFVPTFRSSVLCTTAPMIQKSTVQALCQQISYSDWFFLTAIQQSVMDVDFAKLVDKILIVTQNKGKEHNVQEDDDERSSIYEDSH